MGLLVKEKFSPHVLHTVKTFVTAGGCLSIFCKTLLVSSQTELHPGLDLKSTVSIPPLQSLLKSIHFCHLPAPIWYSLRWFGMVFFVILYNCFVILYLFFSFIPLSSPKTLICSELVLCHSWHLFSSCSPSSCDFAFSFFLLWFSPSVLSSLPLGCCFVPETKISSIKFH